MLWRTSKRKEKPDWDQRTGSYSKFVPGKPKGEKRIWFHAVSVGEVVAALPILREIRRLSPKTKILLSVTTTSGHQTASEKAAGLYDWLVYFPLDLARFQLYAMARVRPNVVAIMETEFWMNFLYNANSFEAKTLLINGRVSDRSFKNSVPIRWFYKSLMRYFDRCLVQSETDKSRIEAYDGKHVEVLGNCKFDQAVEAQTASRPEVLSDFSIDESEKVVVIGSTRSELEESLVIEALTQLKKAGLQFRVIHAPRHIERSDNIVKLAEATGVWKVGQRSLSTQGDYLVLDTYGELSKVYTIATIAIIGGGFDKLGGQNLIQPLGLGVPVIHGPNMFNFKDSSEQAVRAGASVSVEPTVAALKTAVEQMLNDEALRLSMSEKAKTLVAENTGASTRYAQAIVEALG